MKLPNFAKLNKIDFTPEEQALIEKLAGIINPVLDNINISFNNNITLQDNIACTIKDFKVSVNSSGNLNQVISIKLNTNKKALSLLIGNVQPINSSIYPNSSVQIFWSQAQGIVNIEKIVGLTANQLYTINVVIFET